MQVNIADEQKQDCTVLQIPVNETEQILKNKITRALLTTHAYNTTLFFHKKIICIHTSIVSELNSVSFPITADGFPLSNNKNPV